MRRGHQIFQDFVRLPEQTNSTPICNFLDSSPSAKQPYYEDMIDPMPVELLLRPQAAWIARQSAGKTTLGNDKPWLTIEKMTRM